MQKKSHLIYILSFCALFLIGCESKTGTGALVGGGLGVGAGALIGGGQGALIGGAVGVVGGALVGNILEENERTRVERSNPKTLRHIDHNEYLTVEDIIALHNAGISDKKIKDLINGTGSNYSLNTTTIHKLEKAGISSDVINHMMEER